MDKTACIFGSSGLVGSYVLKLLQDDSRYSEIIVFNRTQKIAEHPKIKQIVADYKELNNFTGELNASEFYCCLGTTIKKAKTKEAFEYVDYQLPLQIANIASLNGVEKYLVVSSIGASAQSKNFYLRTKGKMELAIAGLEIKRLHFFRPSLLLGKRNEKRFTESISKVFMKLLGYLMLGNLKKYRAIHAETVAAAMISTANSKAIQQVFISDEIEDIGNVYLAALKQQNC